MSETISKFGHGGPRANSGGPRPGAGRPYKIDIPPPATGPRWHVYQTDPQGERPAAEALTRSGYRSYAPMIAISRQDAVIRSMFHKVRVARFPGYGFVELTPNEPWRPILEATGVSRMLCDIYGRPAPLPKGEIERHMLDDDRLCDLARETMPRLALDSRVTVLEGALTSFEGSVLDCDGLCTTVNVQMFGRLVPVRFDRASVEAV